MKPGVYFGLSAEEYHKVEAVGSSALRDMLISPLDCWARHVNPYREPDEESPATLRGEAFHAILLEGPAALQQRFYPALNRDDYPQVLWSGDQLSAECGMRMLARGGTLMDRAERLLADGFARDRLGPMVAQDYERANATKTEIPAQDWERIILAHEVMEQACIAQSFRGGAPEVSIFWNDEKTGLLCKARIDYLKSASFLDLKSFANKAGKDVETAVAHTFIYQRHHVQARHYCEAIEAAKRHHLPWNEPTGIKAFDGKPHDCFFVYLQTGIAPNVVVRRFAPKSASGPNAYWTTATNERRRALDLYANHLAQFGRDRPWTQPTVIKDFDDADFPGFMLEE
jgi:hypothetical protein